MSAIDELVIDALNNGGYECICTKATPKEAVCYFDRSGRLLFYQHKECPIHGIGRTFPNYKKERPTQPNQAA